MNKHYTHRGHSIIFVSRKWVYADTNQEVSKNKNRDCGYCGKSNTKNGHDGCLGELPGVINACCGHGNIQECYVMFSDKKIIRGWQAMEYIKKVVKDYE
jgi:hypothetical protein